MSRTIARAVTGIIRTLLAPLSTRQQRRVIARVVENLERLDLATVQTARGTLRFRQLRGSFLASAVARFHTDEPETLAWIDTFRPGEQFWDIGANVGVYALYAGLDPELTVLAFEPSGFNFGPLVDHIALNDMGARVSPLCVALGNHRGLRSLYMRHMDAGHGSNALGAATNTFGAFEPVFAQTVPAFSIDDFRATFNLPAPHHIKIDVDGIECEILRGAERTLPEVQSVMMEVEGTTGTAYAPEMTGRLADAGLTEVLEIRTQGSGRNRLYRRG